MPITCPIQFQALSQSKFGSLDYQVMSQAFASQNDLSRLAEEAVYQSDLAVRLNKTGYSVEQEVPVKVTFRSFRKLYSLDLVVNNKAVYELKAVAKLSSRHEAQLMNYLFLLDLERGKLVNFRTDSVESRFVNVAMTRLERRRFSVDCSRWGGAALFRDMIIEMLRDWGTGLELPLYRQAITELLGGEDRVCALLPMTRDGNELASQHFHLVDSDSGFRLTAFSDDLTACETQLRLLLDHSPLTNIHWINIALKTVTFITVTTNKSGRKI